MSDDVIYLQATLRDVVFRVDQVLRVATPDLSWDCVDLLTNVRIDAQTALDHDDATDDHLQPDCEDASFDVAGGTVHMPAVIADTFGGSRSDARRKLAQGAVKIDGEALGAADIDVAPERLDSAILQVGKRQFRRMRRVK